MVIILRNEQVMHLHMKKYLYSLLLWNPKFYYRTHHWNISVFIQIWNLMNVIMNISSELWSNQLNFEDGCCFGLINCCSFFITITYANWLNFHLQVNRSLVWLLSKLVIKTDNGQSRKLQSLCYTFAISLRLNSQHSITSQKTWFFIGIAVRTSNLTSLDLVYLTDLLVTNYYYYYHQNFIVGWYSE